MKATKLSRRSLLVGASALGLASLQTIPVRADTSTSVSPEVLSADVVETFSPDFATQYTMTSPRAIQLRVPERSVAVLDCEFDARVFEFVMPTSPAEAEVLRVITGDGIGGFSIRLKPASGLNHSGGAIVSLPIVPRDVYPNENIGALAPTRVALRTDGAHQSGHEWTSSTSQVSTTQVWGAVLLSAWTRTQPGGDGRLSAGMPRRILIRSIGPSAIPPGVVLGLRADTRVATAFSIAEDSSAAGRPRLLEGPVGKDADGVRHWSVVIEDAIAAGATYVINAEPQFAAPIAAANLATSPVLTLDTTMLPGTARGGRTAMVTTDQRAVERLRDLKAA